MSQSTLAFQLAKPVEEVPEEVGWLGQNQAMAGAYCTTYGYKGECYVRYEGSSMVCTDWSWGTLECYYTY
jgi:hypothetical protein